jgi:hypothetical protein
MSLILENQRNKSGSLNRRALMSILVAAPLSACGSDSTGESSNDLSYSILGDAIAVALGLREGVSVSRGEAAAIPYSTIGIRIGNSAQGLLVLGSKTGASCLWTSGSHIVVVTEGGRIAKTAGLPWNLGGTTFITPDPAADFLKPIPQSRSSRTLDFPDLKRFSVGISSTFESRGYTTITILGQALDTQMMVENCICAEFDWEFQNIYWVDRENGIVWRTVQTSHPKLDPLQIELFRPPA